MYFCLYLDLKFLKPVDPGNNDRNICLSSNAL